MDARESQTAVVFITHQFNEEIIDALHALRDSCKGLHQFFIWGEDATTPPESLKSHWNSFSFPVIRKRARRILGQSLVPGNCHLHALEFFRRNPYFSYYWFIEYDVRFLGDWRAFLESFVSDRCDLLATLIAEEPNWYWWPGTETPGLASGQRLKAFLPIYRISRQGLTALEECVARGWVGHFEGLVPCALLYKGLSLGDIGGAGLWTPPHRIDRFYSKRTMHWEPLLFFSLFRRLGFLRRDFLYHPVKSELSFQSQAKRRMRYWIKVLKGRLVPRLKWIRQQARLFFAPGEEPPQTSSK